MTPARKTRKGSERTPSSRANALPPGKPKAARPAAKPPKAPEKRAAPQPHPPAPPEENLAEYRILVAPHFNERQQQYTTLVVLETAKSFASFRYELSVQERLEERTIRYRILGLKAPNLSLPAAGHAQFLREYADLKGTYEIVIPGLDGNATSFAVRIAPREVHLLHAPKGPAVEVVTDERLWPDKP